MKNEREIKIEIEKDIGDLSKVLSLLSTKYNEDPLFNDAQKSFLSLSVHVGQALNIQLQ